MIQIMRYRAKNLPEMNEESFWYGSRNEGTKMQNNWDWLKIYYVSYNHTVLSAMKIHQNYEKPEIPLLRLGRAIKEKKLLVEEPFLRLP